MLFGITHPGSHARRESTIEYFELGRLQLEFGGRDIFIDAGRFASGGNRHQVGPTGEQPGQRNLRRGRFELGRNLLDLIQERQVALDVFGKETRMIVTALTRIQVVGRTNRCREKTPTERRISHETDAQFATGR